MWYQTNQTIRTNTHMTSTFGFRFSGKESHPLSPTHPLLPLHPYAHITGNRTDDTHVSRAAIAEAFEQINQLSPEQLTLRVTGFEVYTLEDANHTIQPNHVVMVSQSPELTQILAQTDCFAIPERNMVLYHYQPTQGISEQKTFHISLGADHDGARRACFDIGDPVVIMSGFAKYEGPRDPHTVVFFNNR